MRKRMLLGLAAIGVIVIAGAAWFAATESYVLNVKARVATSMTVTPHGTLDWGTVFNQKTRTTHVTISLSTAALAEMNKRCPGAPDPVTGEPTTVPCPNLTGVQYDIGCKGDAKVPRSATNAIADDNICPYITFSNVTGAVGSTQKLTAANNPRRHNISFSAPPCADASQQSPTKPTNANANCDQDNPVDLSGRVFVQRVGFQGDIAKCTLTDKKDRTNTVCPGSKP